MNAKAIRQPWTGISAKTTNWCLKEFSITGTTGRTDTALLWKIWMKREKQLYAYRLKPVRRTIATPAWNANARWTSHWEASICSDRCLWIGMPVTPKQQRSVRTNVTLISNWRNSNSTWIWATNANRWLHQSPVLQWHWTKISAWRNSPNNRKTSRKKTWNSPWTSNSPSGTETNWNSVPRWYAKPKIKR